MRAGQEKNDETYQSSAFLSPAFISKINLNTADWYITTDRDYYSF